MQNLHDSLRLALEAYRKHADPAYIPVYLKQLEDVATARKQGHSIDYRVMAVTITNIEYLTEIGVIKSDSWNGVVYQYEL